MMDLSQKGNWEGFRNVTFQAHADAPVTEGEINSNGGHPGEGIYEFDFISYTRPPGDAKAYPEQEMRRLVSFLKVPWRYGTPNDEAAVQYYIRWCVLPDVYFTAGQVQRILEVIPAKNTQARESLFVTLWVRLLDEENLNLCIGPVVMSDESRLELYKRIGHLAIFNPMDPDGFYSINLARREESIVASVLVRLAYEEPGENVEDPSPETP